ncbi:LOW QUALITY PROTEIN: hypothetical protein PHMEG_0003593 [Phytophthora megakarya]|uniref:Uncharacterized protein n=1 Tax=Phytophthora megakarya TaxID=4795 RepID=A0A225WW44_9STRA|nr:LOW QUALITY PROTEIN: hypothetical protein PHMEG_0003593 [Phytophthora megakarya]
MDAKSLVKDMELARSEQKSKGSCYSCDTAKMKSMFSETLLLSEQPCHLKTFTWTSASYNRRRWKGTRFQWFYGQQTNDKTVNNLRDVTIQIKAKYQKIYISPTKGPSFSTPMSFNN